MLYTWIWNIDKNIWLIFLIFVFAVILISLFVLSIKNAHGSFLEFFNNNKIKSSFLFKSGKFYSAFIFLIFFYITLFSYRLFIMLNKLSASLLNYDLSIFFDLNIEIVILLLFFSNLMNWINIFNYKEKYGYYKKFSLFIATFLFLCLLFTLMMKFGLISKNSSTINSLFYFSVFIDLYISIVYYFNLSIPYILSYFSYGGIYPHIDYNKYMLGVFDLRNPIKTNIHQYPCNTAINSNRGTANIPIRESNQDASNEVVEDINAMAIGSEIGEEANKEVSNENINENNIRNNWFSGIKSIGDNWYPNLLGGNRLMHVPLHIRCQHPEVMELIDKDNQEYDAKQKNCPIGFFNNMLNKKEIIWKFVNEDSEVLKYLLMQQSSVNCNEKGFVDIKDWKEGYDNKPVDEKQGLRNSIRGKYGWRFGIIQKYNVNTSDFDSNIYTLEDAALAIGKDWSSFDIFFRNLEKGMHIQECNPDVLSMIDSNKHREIFISDNNKKYAWKTLRGIHKGFPPVTNTSDGKIRNWPAEIDEYIISQLVGIKNKTLYFLHEKYAGSPLKCIKIAEYNLCMDRYINLMRMRAYLLNKDVYQGEDLAPNPKFFYFLMEHARNKLLVSNSPENSKILAIIKKYNPDWFVNFRLKESNVLNEVVNRNNNRPISTPSLLRNNFMRPNPIIPDPLKESWYAQPGPMRPINAESPQGSRLQSWAKEQSPIIREKPLTPESGDMEVLGKRKRSCNNSDNEHIIKKQKRS